MNTTGFHWKSIEEKPEHWEDIRLLIEDGLEMKQENNSYIMEKENIEKIEIVYRTFLKTFEHIEKIIGNIEEKKEEDKKKKKNIKRSKEIQNKVAEEIINKDLAKFKLKEYVPVRCVFHKTYMMYFLIIWWNIELSKVCKKKRDKKYSIANLNSIFSLRKAINDGIIQEYDILRKMLEDTEKYRQNTEPDIYRNFDLLFEYPQILYHNMYDDRKTRRILYKEQREILNRMSKAISDKKPILMGNQMPTGSGKTFLVIPLARRISVNYENTKTILFCCSNELVNKEISQLALIADDIHLWLAKYVVEPKNKKYMTLLRPHKRCYPASWKKVYKNNTNVEKIGTIMEQMQFYMKQTQRRPNIIVADLISAYEILKEIQDDSIIAYIDEFISGEEADKKMAKICTVLPRHTILLSSILPSFDELKSIVELFCNRHSCTAEECLYRVETLYIPISCAVIDPKGRLSMPHHYVNTKKECELLYDKLKTSPRLRRMYSIRHIYYWSKSLPEKIFEDEYLRFDNRFKDVCSVSIQEMTEYAVQLVNLFIHCWDEYKDEFQKYRPQIIPEWNKEDMLCSLSIYLQEKTLYVTNNVQEDIKTMTRKLFGEDSGIRWSHIEQEKKKAQECYDRQKKSLELNNEMTKIDKWIEINELQEESSVKVHTIPKKFIINTKEHFNRFHSSLTPLMSSIKYTVPLYSSCFYESFDDQFNIWFSAGIGIYDPSCMTSFQLNKVMDYYTQYSFLISNESIVFGTNLPNLCSIIIDSDFVNSHPISHLYQLMGRVGRMGKSYHANIILPDESAMIKIMSLNDIQEKNYIVECFKKETNI